MHCLKPLFQELEGQWTFTLEAGQDETYGTVVLYAHSQYSRSSVMAGRLLRRFIVCWDSWDEARDELKNIGVKYEEVGSTHMSAESMEAHLPDDIDCWIFLSIYCFSIWTF